MIGYGDAPVRCFELSPRLNWKPRVDKLVLLHKITVQFYDFWPGGATTGGRCCRGYLRASQLFRRHYGAVIAPTSKTKAFPRI